MRASILVLCVSAILTAYFGYFALYGRHGMMNYVRTSHEAELLRADLALLVKERETLARKVDMLKPESIDRDLLEELSRDTLGLASPGELVITRQSN